MTTFVDLTGQRFGKLIVLRRVESTKDGRVRWLCECDCGNEVVVRASCLKRGMTQSCGCLWLLTIKKANTKHGYARRNGGSRLHHIHRNMLSRCENPKHIEYQRYGARGIKVCDEWRDLKTFGDWATANGYTDELSIDRIDVNGNYEPSNCRWATIGEQANNKRTTVYVTIEGEKLPLMYAAKKYNCPPYRIRNRLRSGYTNLDLVKEKI